MAYTFSNPGTREREYLYIDGGSLREAVRKISQELLDDPEALKPLISGFSSGGFDKTFYYDAVPGIDHGEPQAAYERRVQPDYDRLNAIQGLDRVHVAYGKIVGKNKRQKGVDVRLAVEVMTAAFRGKVSKITIFAGDSDFEPLLRALVAEGLHVTLWHPKQAAADLKRAADTTKLFDFASSPMLLTRDGSTPAFYVASSGSGGVAPENDGLTKIMSIEADRYAAKWDSIALRVWRSSCGGSWEYVNFHAATSRLEEAVKAFKACQGWAIPDGTDWIAS